jgi:hypothetical protein
MDPIRNRSKSSCYTSIAAGAFLLAEALRRKRLIAERRNGTVE